MIKKIKSIAFTTMLLSSFNAISVENDEYNNDYLSEDNPIIFNSNIKGFVDIDIINIKPESIDYLIELSKYSDDTNIDIDDLTIKIQLANIKSLNKRSDSGLTILQDRTLSRLTQNFNEKNAFTVCFDSKKDDIFNEILQCTLIVDEIDIANSLIIQGMAEYSTDGYNPWQHDLYLESENSARSRGIGKWSSSFNLR